MTTFARQLTQEIARVARKQIRQEVAPLRKLAAGYRSEIAALKRQLRVLQGQLRELSRGQRRAAGAPAEAGAPSESRRKPRAFSAAAFAAQRKRLGLSQAQMGQLLGVSSLSVHKWEKGGVQPRARQLQAIASLRGLGKKAARARLG